MRRLILPNGDTHALYEKDGSYSRTLCGQYLQGGVVDHGQVACGKCRKVEEKRQKDRPGPRQRTVRLVGGVKGSRRS
jgi:hypothetical protein